MSQCEDLLAEEFKDQLTKGQVKEVARLLDKNAERIMQAGSVLGYEQAYSMAAKEIAEKLKAAAAIEKRNAAYNAKVRLEAVSQIRSNWPKEKLGEGLLSFLEGTYRDVDTGRFSVAARQRARQHRYAAGFMADIEKTGLLKELASGAFDDDIRRALSVVDDPNVKFSGPKEAMELAKVIRQWQEKARIDANRVGAWIGKEENYIQRQAHDDLKIMAAGETAWIDGIIDKLDWNRIEAEHVVEDRRDWLKQVYSNLASGVHLKAGDGTGFTGPANLAKKLSQNRVLHFKDADSFIEYNKQFGFSERMVDQVMRMLDHAGRTTELMSAMGTNPASMLSTLTKDLANSLEDAPPEVRQNFEKMASKAQDSMKVLDGTIHTIKGGMQNVAKWGYLLRAHQSLTKLGGMIMSQLSDLGVMGSAFKYDGGSYLGAIGKTVQGLAEGKTAGERQRLYAGLGHYTDVFNQSLSAYTTGIDTPAGFTGKMMNLFFKLNLSEWWQTGNRNAAFSFYAGILGDQRGLKFDELLPETQRALRQYGISPEQWEVMRQVADKTEDGRDWITFDALRQIPDTEIAKLVPEANERSIAAMRDELETKLSTYYTDRVANAHLMPDAGTMRVMTQGTQRGSVEGELIRFIGQFKAFPTAFIRQTVMRELYGRRGLDQPWGMSEVAGVAKLVATMTAFGYLSMALKDMVKGKHPRGLQDPGDDSDGVYYVDLPFVNEKTLTSALLQGGGLGIYGDFLFGEMRNRNGQGFLSTMAGPALGNVESIVDLLGRLKSGEDPRATAAKLAINNVPLVNLFYTKMLLDYYVTWNMMEAIDPGSVYRMERRIEKEQNTTFWLPPSGALR